MLKSMLLLVSTWVIVIGCTSGGNVYYTKTVDLKTGETKSGFVDTNGKLNNKIERLNESALLVGSGSGDIKTVREILAKGVNPNISDINIAKETSRKPLGLTPLLLASGMGHVEIVKLLLEKGAEINKSDVNGQTPLMYAALKGRTEVGRLLIEKGAQINAQDKNNNTALSLAKKAGHVQIVKMLQDAGAKE